MKWYFVYFCTQCVLHYLHLDFIFILETQCRSLCMGGVQLAHPDGGHCSWAGKGVGKGSGSLAVGPTPIRVGGQLGAWLAGGGATRTWLAGCGPDRVGGADQGWSWPKGRAIGSWPAGSVSDQDMGAN